MVRDNAVIDAGLLARQCNVQIVIACDLIDKCILKHGKTVAESDGDVSKDLAVGQLENTIRRQGRMLCRKLRKTGVQVIERLLGDCLLYTSRCV